MNANVIARYLQLLRKDHGYTQEELAQELNVSRQAVSKWETGTTIPNLEVLLKLSKLYGLTINELIEPNIEVQRITDFEQISVIPESELKEVLERFDAVSIVTASMGASPDINRLLEKLLSDIDFKETRNQIGRVRIDKVEDIQNQIVFMINFQALTNFT